MKKFLLLFILIQALLTQTNVWASSLKANVVLTPVGDFEATSEELKGEILFDGKTISSQKIELPVKSLETGMEMRDEHLQDKLLQKNPSKNLEATEIKGEGGKGTFSITINGIKKLQDFTYQIKGDEGNAQFKIVLSQFDLKGLNYMGVGVEDEVNVEIKLPIKKIKKTP